MPFPPCSSPSSFAPPSPSQCQVPPGRELARRRSAFGCREAQSAHLCNSLTKFPMPAGRHDFTPPVVFFFFFSSGGTPPQSIVFRWKQRGNSRLCLTHREKRPNFFRANAQKKREKKAQKHPPKTPKSTNFLKEKSRLRAEKKRRRACALTREKIIIFLA